MYDASFRNTFSMPTYNRFLLLGLFPIIRPSILCSHRPSLGKSRADVSRCLPPGISMETPSPASMSFAIRPSSSLVQGCEVRLNRRTFGCPPRTLLPQDHRGTTCRWRGGNLEG